MKDLGISKSAATAIKNAMNAGKPQTALKLANASMNGFGVECLYPNYPNFYFVSMGDTYSTTLCFTGASFIICSWGDWVETHKPVANDGSNPINSKYWR